jgi:hypothetical protein
MPLCVCGKTLTDLRSEEERRRWWDRRGECWDFTANGTPYWQFCISCHMGRWPHDRRFNNRWSTPASPLYHRVMDGKSRLVAGDFYLTRPPPERLSTATAAGPRNVRPRLFSSPSGSSSAGLCAPSLAVATAQGEPTSSALTRRGHVRWLPASVSWIPRDQPKRCNFAYSVQGRGGGREGGRVGRERGGEKEEGGEGEEGGGGRGRSEERGGTIHQDIHIILGLDNGLDNRILETLYIYIYIYILSFKSPKSYCLVHCPAQGLCVYLGGSSPPRLSPGGCPLGKLFVVQFEARVGTVSGRFPCTMIPAEEITNGFRNCSSQSLFPNFQLPKSKFPNYNFPTPKVQIPNFQITKFPIPKFTIPNFPIPLCEGRGRPDAGVDKNKNERKRRPSSELIIAKVGPTQTVWQ